MKTPTVLWQETTQTPGEAATTSLEEIVCDQKT